MIQFFKFLDTAKGDVVKDNLIHPIIKAYEEDWLNLEIADPKRLLPLLKQYPERVEGYGNVQ